jgi:phosphoglucomutase
MTTEAVRKKLIQACEEKQILPSARDNCLTWLNPDQFDPWIIDSVRELIEGGHWVELNDRFYKTLAFGTGGLRGRTIGKLVMRAEQGSRSSRECPEHPAVGSNCMNDFNVRRATMGLVTYVKKACGAKRSPHIVIAFDSRHFSRRFAELTARTVVEMGGKASVFESERATPELSFAVRELGADAGVVVTASHNPSHDNGYKAYFSDGAQVIEPHASGIIREVNAISVAMVCRKASRFAGTRLKTIGEKIDRAYMTRVLDLVLEPEVVSQQGSRMKIVYSPLHGTGAKLVPTLLSKLGVQILTVPEQMVLDGRFPTVKSPNPENAEALTLSIRLAEKEGAEVVLATDPDGDRMGVAVANRQGKLELLTGNQIGSLIAHYRLERLFERGILNDGNRSRARLVKTVVTTQLQHAIAEKFRIQVPETLTGFKYIGEKLQKYEKVTLDVTGMKKAAYRKLPEKKKRGLLLQKSFYYVFGGEESYGYSASDFTRDKDANSACVMFAELATFVKSKGLTVQEYLNTIYSELGYYSEKLGQMVYEGAEGAARIHNILRSYETHPPTLVHGLRVVRIRNHDAEEIRDCEGDVLPKEKLFFIDLENGARCAVRGSGTEPKIKFYFFAYQKPPSGQRYSETELAGAKTQIVQFLDSLWKAVEADARERAGK